MLLVDHGEREVLEVDPLLEERVGADQDIDLAGGQRRQRSFSRAPRIPPREQGEGDAAALQQSAERIGVLVGQQLGRHHQSGLRAGLHRDQHGKQRHHGLAAADVALEEAEHAAFLREVLDDLGGSGALAFGQSEGEGGLHRAAEPAVAGDGATAPASGGAAHQRQRQLVRQQLVVGEARAGRGVGLKVGGVLGRMRGLERLVPGRPPTRCHQARLDPFGQRRRPRQRGAHRAGHRLQRDPRRQRIDGLDRLHAIPLVERRDVVGVHHLDFAAVAFDAPAHHPHGPFGQLLAEPVALRVEEDEREGPGLVRAIDPGGAAPVRRGLVAIDPHRERRRGAGLGFGDLRRVAPVDQPRREMPKQMHRQRPGQTLDSRRGAGADSWQHRRRREERIEDRRAHGLAA